mmetsp:Transcript_110576/g.323555  ORF Transcript_110576/g.323555 Transcript_110576/m.323555 type:complete len:381 (+) Transcript_110576:620-1762(+)
MPGCSLALSAAFPKACSIWPTIASSIFLLRISIGTFALFVLQLSLLEVRHEIRQHRPLLLQASPRLSQAPQRLRHAVVPFVVPGPAQEPVVLHDGHQVAAVVEAQEVAQRHVGVLPAPGQPHAHDAVLVKSWAFSAFERIQELGQHLWFYSFGAAKENNHLSDWRLGRVGKGSHCDTETTNLHAILVEHKPQGAARGVLRLLAHPRDVVQKPVIGPRVREGADGDAARVRVHLALVHAHGGAEDDLLGEVAHAPDGIETLELPQAVLYAHPRREADKVDDLLAEAAPVLADAHAEAALHVVQAELPGVDYAVAHAADARALRAAAVPRKVLFGKLDANEICSLPVKDAVVHSSFHRTLRGRPSLGLPSARAAPSLPPTQP